jgi:hypothetical protein
LGRQLQPVYSQDEAATIGRATMARKAKKKAKKIKKKTPARKKGKRIKGLIKRIRAWAKKKIAAKKTKSTSTSTKSYRSIKPKIPTPARQHPSTPLQCSP